MKGDFTRFTFRPQKHYTSVLMQQGRLQLDSDWNEQAEIQAHFYRTQVVDLIGAESGVPTSENDPNQPDQAYKDGFKISVTPNDPEGHNDLAIAPGHFYVNGTLCELEATPVEIKQITAEKRIQVDSLIVDNRKFEDGQWVEAADNKQEIGNHPINSAQLFQIVGNINSQTLELTLNDKLPENSKSVRRIITYKTQPDLPHLDKPSDGLHLAYLDVYQRHITTVEDPQLREVALNIPDTTTRTKTVWQLKLLPLNRKSITENISTEQRAALLETLNNLTTQELKQKFDGFLNSKIATENQQGARDRFNALLQTVLVSSAEQQPWQQEFTGILNQITQKDQDALKQSFQDLLQAIASTDSQRQKIRQLLEQLISKAILTSEDKTALKEPFEKLLDKVLPTTAKIEELHVSLDALLKKVIPIQAKQEELQQSFKALLEEVVLNPTEQENLQNSFDGLSAKLPPEVTNEDKEAGTEKTNELLEKAKELNQQATKLQTDFADFVEKAIAAEPIRQEIESYEKDETTSADLGKPEWNSFIKETWNAYFQSNKERKASMNACAKLCASSGNVSSNGGGYQRVENQLYRVEIHDPGEVGDHPSKGENKKQATFKWSRDNGSIVGIIDNSENFQRGIITIRKSAQDAWAASQSGQWVEFLDEERELKGLPGQLARLNRVFGNKIEFDASSLVGDSLPHPTKVRRWDHMTKDASLLTRTEWLPLEAGIKVRFDQASEYKTGDYWLIPARAATYDIEWPNDQNPELKKRQPLPQPTLGIHHDYCLLATVMVENGNFLPIDPKQDHRFIFPALVNAFDKRGGVIEGNLGIGIANNEKPIARLQARASNLINGQGKISRTDGTAVTGIQSGQDATNFSSELHPGDLIKIGQHTRVVVEVTARNSLTIDQELPSPIVIPTEFQYQQPIARLENDQDEAQFIILANSHTGIGTSAPQAELEVKGKIRTTDLDVTGKFAAETFEGAAFKITKNPTSNSPIAYGLIRASSDENPKRVEFVGDQAKLFAFTNASRVGIGDTAFLAAPSIPLHGLVVQGAIGLGIPNPSSQLGVAGNVAIGKNLAGSQAAPTDGLLVEGQVAIGIPIPDPKAKLHVHGGVVRISSGNGSSERNVQIGRSEDGEWCNFLTTCPRFYFDQGITLEPHGLKAQQDADTLIALHISAGQFNDNGHNNVKHYGLVAEDSIVKAKTFEGDGSGLTGVVKTEGNNVWDGKLTVKGSTSLATTSTPTDPNPTVGIGVENPASKLAVDGNVAIGNKYVQAQAPDNGLLVQGSVGIGDFDLPLNAKLEIQGASQDQQQAALSVTDSERKNLLWVRNDGKVGIGIADLQNIQEKLHVNGSLKVGNDIKGDRLIISADQLPPGALSAKLYVNGSLYVEEKIFAKNVLQANEFQGQAFKQISSRTLKEEVGDLSSQEVEQILQNLNPVKFIYTQDITKSLHAGFIAEDTPDLLTSSDKQAIKILDVVAILTKAVKDQQTLSEELSEVVKNQRNELERLQEKLQALEAQHLEGRQAIATFSSPLNEQSMRRSPSSSRQVRRSLYHKLKRLIRQLFSKL